MADLAVLDLGITDFQQAYALQRRLISKKRAADIDDHLFLTEHSRVITIGRRGSRENLLAGSSELDSRGFSVVETDRGGDVTLHGEGQIVAYPVFDLTRHGKDIRSFLKGLERVLRSTVESLGLRPDRDDRSTGLWVDGAKIGFIGIGVTHWISYHGISLNVSIDPALFSMIRPCGIRDIRVDNIERKAGRPVGTQRVKDLIRNKFVEVFGFGLQYDSQKDAALVKEGFA